MNAGKKLRALRIKLRLSQKELGNQLGTKRWIPYWECGRYPTPPYIWLALEKLENQKKVPNRI